MNIETVNEIIASLESAGELSIKERKYLELGKAYVDREAESVALALTFEKCREIVGCPAGVDLQDWVKRLAAERDEALNAERIWEKTMMEVCGEDGPASVASEIRSLQALRDTAMQALKSQVGQLAAENVGLKSFGGVLFDMYKGLEISGGGIHDEQSVVCQQAALDAAMSAFEEIETPATDRIHAGIKADGVEEWVSSRGGRWNGTTEEALKYAAQLRKGASE